MNSISPILNIMIKASEKASKIIIRDFGEIENLQVARKGPRDFVTKTDKKVEKILIEELSKGKKNYSFFTEESGRIENEDKNKIWIIDPIDGTTNFLHGIPHFAISIALKIENEIETALIFDPIKNEIFYAEKNNGAYFNNHRIRVSKKSNLEECLFATDQLGLKNIFPRLNMRCTGSASLDMAYTGSGRFDGFVHNKIHLWDIAAGMLIVKEAGGTINDVSNYNDESIDIRAASNNIYDKMMERLDNF
jgi:myo-inositol-1(or 4)-monophosphatase